MRRIYFFFFLCCFGFSLHAIPTAIAEGAYVNMKNESVKGHFEIPTAYLNKTVFKEYIYWKVKFASPDSNPEVLLPNSCKGFRFIYKGQQFEFVAIENKYGWKNPFKEDNQYVFVEALIPDGTYKFFQFSYFGHDSGMYFEDGMGGGSGDSGGRISKVADIIQKDDQLILLKRIGWKKQLNKLFKDNVEVLKLIRKTKRKNIWALVLFANNRMND